MNKNLYALLLLLQICKTFCNNEKTSTLKVGVLALGSTVFFGALTVNCIASNTCNTIDSRNLAVCTAASAATTFLCVLSLCDNTRKMSKDKRS